MALTGSGQGSLTVTTAQVQRPAVCCACTTSDADDRTPMVTDGRGPVDAVTVMHPRQCFHDFSTLPEHSARSVLESHCQSIPLLLQVEDIACRACSILPRPSARLWGPVQSRWCSLSQLTIHIRIHFLLQQPHPSYHLSSFPTYLPTCTLPPLFPT